MEKNICKKIRNYIGIVLILVSVFGVCFGCSPQKTQKPQKPQKTDETLPNESCPTYETTPRRETPMSVEEIREMIQKRYFNEDGSVNKERWLESTYFPSRELEGFLNQEITGFEVQIIKNAEGKEESFLVEFEPTGHAVGSVWLEKVEDFHIYPSAFKTLKVEEDNRYLFHYLQWWAYATMVDGELIEIRELGLARVSEFYNESYKSVVAESYRESYMGGYIEVYNFEKKSFDWGYFLRDRWVTDEGYEAPLYNPEDGWFIGDVINR